MVPTRSRDVSRSGSFDFNSPYFFFNYCLRIRAGDVDDTVKFDFKEE